jgi:integrase
MSLRMAKPWRHPQNGIWYARLTLPVDLQPVLNRVEIRRSLGTRDDDKAKTLFVQAVAEIHAEWEKARVAADFVAAPDPDRPAPRTISHKEALGLAGEFYRALIAENEDNPGSHKQWEKALAGLQRLLPSSERTPGALVPFVDRIYLGHVRNAVQALGPEVRAFLDGRQDNLAADSFVNLCSLVALAKRDAFEHLMRLSRNDYAPDPKANRFPPAPAAPSTVTPDTDDRLYDYVSVCDDWYAAGGIAPKTRKSWVGKMRMVTTFLGKDDLAAITQEDVIRWRDQRQAQGIAARTISYADMAGPRAIYNWAIASKKYPRITINPFAEMAVKVRKKKKTREKGFTWKEAEKILCATMEPVGDRFSEAGAGARRWAPWLAAYSGARIGEITQLNSSNVVEEETPNGRRIWCMRLTPDDGSIKTDEYRLVPIHPHILEQGFLRYVKQRQGKPLFYEPDLARVADPANTQADKAGQRLAAWVRDLGIEGVPPNHGWRHRLKTISRKADIDRDVGNYLTGHSAENVAAEYGDYLVEVLYREVCKLPRYLSETRTGEDGEGNQS